MPVKMDADPEVFDSEALALQYIIRNIIKNEVNTCEVVRVVAVDSANKELTVIPVVCNVDASGNTVQESNIYCVKYFQWQFGGNLIEALPEVGDVGFIVVSKRDISKIKAGIVDSRRKFNLADSIYIGGLYGFNKIPTQYIKFNTNGIEVVSPTALNVSAPVVNVEATTSATVSTGEAVITATGNVAISGSNVAITGSTVSVGSGSGGKAVVLDGDPVYNGSQQQIGTVKATSTAVTAN